MRIVLGVAATLVAAFALWGIGSFVRRVTRSPRGTWVVSIGLGLASLVFTGGLLNLLHVAYRPVIWLLIVCSLLVAILEARRTGFHFAEAIPKGTPSRIEAVLTALVIAAVMLFAIATQLPPREFNYQDDLQKYFAHPVRMLETGTLRGSPLSALGSETLGGQAFLHAIVHSVAPLPYINGVDAVFSLFALMLVAASAAWRRFGWFPGAALAALTVALVNPLYANVSALYTAALLMATAVMLAADEKEDSSPLLLGLAYAALLAIKPTFGIFVVFHALFLWLADGIPRGGWSRVLRGGLRLVGATCLFLAPWPLIFLPTYVSHGAFNAQAQLSSLDLADVSFFSGARLFDGDSVVPYTALAAVAALVALAAVLAVTRKTTPAPSRRESAGIFAGAAAGVACFLILILYLSLWGGYQSCVRYSVPFLLGGCLISVLMAPELVAPIPRSARIGIPLAGCAAVALLFAPAAVQRARQALSYGSILEFTALADSPEYLSYNRYALSDAARRDVEALQTQVPLGQSLFAWIDTPFYLDYRRNPIVDMDFAGTATSWAHVPPDTQYFLWEYQGYAMWNDGDYLKRSSAPGIGARDRLIARRSFDFAKVMTELANHSQVVAQLTVGGDRYVLFKLPGLQSAPSSGPSGVN